MAFNIEAIGKEDAAGDEDVVASTTLGLKNLKCVSDRQRCAGVLPRRVEHSR